MMMEFSNTEIAFRYRSDRDLKLAFFLFSVLRYPFLSRMGIGLVKFLVRTRLPVLSIIKQTLFRQFCGGETIQEAAQTANRLSAYGVGIILDYGVEGKEQERDFDHTTQEFLKAITFASGQKNIPFISLKVTGFARFELLEKVHAGVALNIYEVEEWKRVHRRIEIICTTAYQHHIKVLVDAEETWIQEAVNELTERMMEKFNRGQAMVFNTFQLYTHGTLHYLKDCYQKALDKNYILGAKLVRGAYMEKERARALEKNYRDPIQVDKRSTDLDFDSALLFCLQHVATLSLFIGTHNEKSCLNAVHYMTVHHIKPDHPNVCFSQLYGMSDNISFNLAQAGYHVSKYLPYGPVREVVPYLLRRAEENTSVAGQTGRELSMIRTEIKRRAGK